MLPHTTLNIFVVIPETRVVSQFCYIYVLLSCSHISVINFYMCLLFSGPGACYFFAIINEQLTTRLELNEHGITDKNL